MKRAASLLLIVAGLVAHGCGGSTAPSAPSIAPTPTPTPAAVAPAVFDGLRGQAVAADVTPASVRAGDALLARAPGYLLREQRYTGVPVFLWPTDDEGYIEQVVYWEFTDGSLRMVRWAGPFTVTLDGELAEDNAVIAKAREVVAEAQRVTGLAITIGAGGACLVQLGPDLGDAVGRARLRFSGPTIVGATLNFVSRAEITGGSGSDWRNTLLHEMGHALGLLHSRTTAT